MAKQPDKPSAKAQAATKPREPKKAAAAKQAPKMPSTAVRRALFLEVLRRTANVSRSARESGLATSTVYARRRVHDGFKADWDAAMAEAIDLVEESVVTRVRDGVERPVFYGGEKIGSVRQYSDALAMFLLKSKRPEIYNRLAFAADAPTTLACDMNEAEAEAEFDRRMQRLAAR